MLAFKQINPPGQFKPDGIGEPVVGVRVFARRDALGYAVYQKHDRAGTNVLCSLLQARMELAGVRVTEISEGFPLNDAAFIFTVSELVPAQEAVKQELEKLGLLGWAQIGWHDPREGVWRLWHPKAGRFDSPSPEELSIEGKIFAALISFAEKLPVLKDEPSGQ